MWAISVNWAWAGRGARSTGAMLERRKQTRMMSRSDVGL